MLSANVLQRLRKDINLSILPPQKMRVSTCLRQFYNVTYPMKLIRCLGFYSKCILALRWRLPETITSIWSKCTKCRKVVCILVVTAAAIPGSTGSMQKRRSEEHTSELQSQSNLVCR